MSSPAFCEFCRSYAAAIVLDAEAKPLGFVRNRHANFLWTGVSVSIEDRLLRAKILAWCIMALTGYAPAMSFRGKGRMARDRGLEELLGENLAGTPGLTQKAMFGGLAWLVNGNLLCGASDGGMLVRLGKDNDAWALKIPALR